MAPLGVSGVFLLNRDRNLFGIFWLIYLYFVARVFLPDADRFEAQSCGCPSEKPGEG